MTRAECRAQTARWKLRIRRYSALDAPAPGGRWQPTQDSRRIGIIATTRAPCSCIVCQNPEERAARGTERRRAIEREMAAQNS